MSTLDKLATALQDVVGMEYLRTDTTTADYAVDGVVPAIVALPADEEQVADILRLAGEYQATVFPRGGGSHMSLGQTPERVDLVLSVQRLQKQLAYEPGDMTTTVQAGLGLAELQQTLRGSGQFLALDPPATADTTVGGMIATNVSGPRRLLYGTARDVVLGTAVISADGTRTKAGGRVVKNVTGYDLNKLYIGSLGTLAIITELTFKIHPLPPGEATLGISCAHYADTLPLLQLLLQLPLRLNSIELLNAAAMATLTAHTGISMPDTAYLLVVRVEGAPQVTASQTRRLTQALRSTQLTTSAHVHTWTAAEQERLWPGLADILQAPDGVMSKVSLRMSDLPTLCYKVQEIAAGAACPLLAHAGSGVAYVHLPADEALTPPEAQRVLEKVQALDACVAQVHGHRVIERAPLAVKRHCEVWGVTGDSFHVMQALKQSFDPQRRLNPGRFIGGL